MFLVGAEAGSGWWVCSLGVLPPSEQMGLKEFPEGGGTAPPGKAQGLLSCPDGPFIKRLLFLLQMALATAWFFPTSGVHFSERGEEEHCQLKRWQELRSPNSVRFTAHLTLCDRWPRPHWVEWSAVSQDLPKVLGQL